MLQFLSLYFFSLLKFWNANKFHCVPEQRERGGSSIVYIFFLLGAKRFHINIRLAHGAGVGRGEIHMKKG